MNEILKVLLSLSVSGSIVALTLFALKPFLKDRFSKTWQYYAWLVVIIRLLIPYTPQTSIVGELFNRAENFVMAKQGASVNTTDFALSHLGDATVLPGHISNPNNNGLANAQTQQVMGNVTGRDFLHEIENNLWLVWLGVAMLLFVRKVTSYHSFVRYIKAGMYEVTDPAMLDTYKYISAASGVKKPLALYTNSLAASPMLIGIFRPFIVLPSMEVGEKELHNIYVHELTHYKRLDILYKWLTQFAVCLHWFNPLVYFISYETNKNCELSCDEAIIKRLNPQEKRSYGDTLLASLKSNGHYSNTVVSITLNEDAALLKERLGAIMSYKKQSMIIRGTSIILTLLLFCGASFTGAYAATHNAQDGKSESNEIFNITARFASAGSGYYSNSPFTLDADTAIHISVHMTSEIGQLRFFVQPINTGSYIANDGSAHDKNGKIIDTVYDISGNNHEETIVMTLKAGKYLAAFRGMGKLQNVKCNIVGVKANETKEAPSIPDSRDAFFANNIPEHFTSDGIANTSKNSNTYTYNGVLGSAKYQLGTPFYTKKGNQLTFELISLEYVSGEPINNKNLLRVLITSNDGKNMTGFTFTTVGGINASFPTNITGDNLITIYNDSDRELKYSFAVTIEPPAITEKGSANSNPNTAQRQIDARALEIIQKTGNWKYIESLLPDMSSGGVDKVALVVTQKTGNWKYIEPMLPYMTNGGIDSVVALWNKKNTSQPNKAASNYYGKTDSNTANPESQTIIATDYDELAKTLMQESNDLHSIAGLASLMSTEVLDDVVTSYVHTANDFNKTYALCQYMSTDGIDKLVIGYVDGTNDYGTVGAMLQFMSKKASNSVAQRYFQESSDRTYDWIYRPYMK